MACRDEATEADFASGHHGHGHGHGDHGHGHGHGHGHDHKHEEEDVDSPILWKVIDIDKCRCLNESRQDSCKNIFKRWDDRLDTTKVTTNKLHRAQPRSHNTSACSSLSAMMATPR
mgnify:CR=1 FL=1